MSAQVKTEIVGFIAMGSFRVVLLSFQAAGCPAAPGDVQDRSGSIS